MSFQLDDIACIYPDQLLLEFTPKERDRAWEKTSEFNDYDATTRWQAFLNILSYHTMIKYLKNEPDFNQTRFQTSPDTNEFPHLWKLLNGIAITLNQTRLIILPSEETNAEELRVPQEWVDLPKWVGNYYLASHINVEKCWLRVSGFATHEQLSTQGKYDPIDKTYSLEIDTLTEDLSTMWVAWKLSLDTPPEVASLPTLSSKTATDLIEGSDYSKPNLLRLAIPFQQWGALVLNQTYRKLLYNYSQNSARIIHLGQWFKRIFEAGWSSLEDLMEDQSLNLAYSLRSVDSIPEEVAKGVKLLDLGSENQNQVALIVRIFSKNEDKIAIRIQLQSINEEHYLPSNLQLALLSRSNEVLQKVEARNRDYLLQLKQFTCKDGIMIKVQVRLDDLTITECFKVAIP